MIKPELYNKTVDILYQAYFNDTLQHTNCYACAVGNLVAANCGFEFEIEPNAYWPLKWKNIGYPTQNGWGDVILGLGGMDLNKYRGSAKFQIDSTGYSCAELARIEKAFENVSDEDGEEQYMFDGLCAVLEVLKEIHQVTDEDLLQSNNKRFTDHYEKRKVLV